MSLWNEVRWEQSVAELDRLEKQFCQWHADAIEFDFRKQYRTQLEAVHRLVTGAVAAIRDPLGRVKRGGTTGDVFEECNAYDQRTAWVRRVWRFFADKFDQRRDDHPDPRLGAGVPDFLRAADEVVWSCYRQVFEGANKLKAAPTAVPMPYVEPWFSPAAVPPQLRFIPDTLLAEIEQRFRVKFLRRLPLAVLRIPLAHVRSPWWLVLLAHETGHHLQFQLSGEEPEEDGAEDGDPKLVRDYEAVVRNTVRKALDGTRADVADAVAEEWAGWSKELFADVVSVLLLGPTAIKAMVALERASEVGMRKRRQGYPPVAVRLAFLAGVAREVGVEQ